MAQKLYWAVGLIILAGGGLAFYVYRSDKNTAEQALALITEANGASLGTLDEAYAKARLKAVAVYFGGTRTEALAEIQKVYDHRLTVLDESLRLKERALSLMRRRYFNVLHLRTSRVSAEQLAEQIRVPELQKGVLATVAKMFDEQREMIAAEDRIRAEEALRRRLEAERHLREAQERAAAEAVARQLRAQELATQAEAERLRLGQESQRQAAYTPPSKDCCCKTKVDVGLFVTKYETRYKRLEREKCADPAWFDAHKEGWCVPDSYCY